MKDSQLIIPSLQQIVNFFSEAKIEQIAKETSFLVRKRNLSPLVFLGIFTFGLIQKADATLVQLISMGKRIVPSLSISPQGLHKRINNLAVEFLKKMFAFSLSLCVERAENLQPLFLPFDRVHILDSSHITLPDEVASLFLASGGNRSQAGAKIQLMMDYKTGNFSHIWLTDGVTPVKRQLDTAIEQVKANELMLFDLGYVSQRALKTIDDNRGFFVCLLQTQTSLYIQNAVGDEIATYLSSLIKCLIIPFLRSM